MGGLCSGSSWQRCRHIPLSAIILAICWPDLRIHEWADHVVSAGLALALMAVRAREWHVAHADVPVVMLQGACHTLNWRGNNMIAKWPVELPVEHGCIKNQHCNALLQYSRHAGTHHSLSTV